MNVPSKRILLPGVVPDFWIQGMMPEEVAFILEVIELRRERQWSMEEVEHLCGVKRQTVSALERGQVSPTLATALKLGHGFYGDVVPILERSRRWLMSLVLPLLSLEDLPVFIGC